MKSKDQTGGGFQDAMMISGSVSGCELLSKFHDPHTRGLFVRGVERPSKIFIRLMYGLRVSICRTPDINSIYQCPG